MNPQTHCNEYAFVSRREFLASSVQAGAGLLLGNSVAKMPAWMPRITLADPHVGPRGDTLVCIFLRGGADGLNIIVPHGDDAYYDHRPRLAIPRPDDKESGVLDLDGFFGLHPSLESLLPIYQAGDLLPVHATGSPDESRSHFEAMALMERGALNGDYTGWLARHLATLDSGNDSALRAVSIGEMLPASLSGNVSATALRTIADYHLQGRDEQVGQMQQLLAQLYNQGDDLLTASANQTFAAIEQLQRINVSGYKPRGRAYPEDEFGASMQVVAQLIRENAGIEVACVDFGGWDTHVAQGSTEGQFATLLQSLGAGLAAFYEDIQPDINKVSVVVMSEFGRRVKENAGRGTDHGHGNMMLLLGGGVTGGRVFANWPGLQPEQQAGPGDLAITTDYRDVLSELLQTRLKNPRTTDVFPNYAFTPAGLFVQ